MNPVLVTLYGQPAMGLNIRRALAKTIKKGLQFIPGVGPAISAIIPERMLTLPKRALKIPKKKAKRVKPTTVTIVKAKPVVKPLPAITPIAIKARQQQILSDNSLFIAGGITLAGAAAILLTRRKG